MSKQKNYPRGKISMADEGELEMRTTIDPRTHTFVIDFGKPVEGIGFGEEDMEMLIGLFQKGLEGLRALPKN